MESIESKRTKFLVYFPLIKEPVAAKKPADRAIVPRGHGESILGIDDIREQRDIASEIFAKGVIRFLWQEAARKRSTFC